MTYAGIAISGKAGAGKNALADELNLRLVGRGLWPFEITFAEGVKRELLERYGMRKEDPGGREKLVEIGHGRRQVEPDYWVHSLADRLAHLNPFGGYPVITDMRYKNEYDWARRAGFLMVRVDATQVDRMAVLGRRGEDPLFSESEHPSECELDEEQFTVRFWNPHGELLELGRWAYRIAELACGEVEAAA